MMLLAQVRLLHLASQALPVGGYSHSHGLEAAIESHIVRDEDSLRRWIGGMLEFSLGSYEAGCLLDLQSAWEGAQHPTVARLNDEFLATRESAELRAATVQMGYSLRRLLTHLPQTDGACAAALERLEEPSLPCVWAAAANLWALPADAALAAYLWSWVENQVLVALKAVPLGQSAGQRVLIDAAPTIAVIAGRSRHARPASNFAPALAILSSRHETQYSRLFRS